MWDSQVNCVIYPENDCRRCHSESAVEQHEAPGVRPLRVGYMREYFLERLDLGGKQKSDKSEPGTETVQDQVVHIKNPDDEAELHDFDR